MGDDGKPKKNWILTGYADPNFSRNCCGGIHEDTSAFLSSELGEMLPRDVASFKDVGRNGHTLKGWNCRLYSYKTNSDISFDSHTVWGKTEADARAKLLIYLIENSLLDVKGLK